jgi:hypothetical protein
MVEQSIRNRQIVSSILTLGSIILGIALRGGLRFNVDATRRCRTADHTDRSSSART